MCLGRPWVYITQREDFLHYSLIMLLSSFLQILYPKWTNIWNSLIKKIRDLCYMGILLQPLFVSISFQRFQSNTWRSMKIFPIVVTRQIFCCNIYGYISDQNPLIFFFSCILFYPLILKEKGKWCCWVSGDFTIPFFYLILPQLCYTFFYFVCVYILCIAVASFFCSTYANCSFLYFQHKHCLLHGPFCNHDLGNTGFVT